MIRGLVTARGRSAHRSEPSQQNAEVSAIHQSVAVEVGAGARVQALAELTMQHGEVGPFDEVVTGGITGATCRRQVAATSSFATCSTVQV